MNPEPLIIERILDAPVEKVWQAITDPDKIRAWSFDMKGFKPEVGIEFQFSGENDGRQFLHLCKVTEVIPMRKLTYSWAYQNYPGISYVSFELFDQGAKTKLRLTHSGLQSFPADNQDFARGNFTSGWNQIIGTHLKNFLETK
jgi:uncharacterized protein YndB with AHSA1/START domain